MTTNGNSPHGVAPVLEGPVEARNPNGIKVRGNWCNVSKFHPIDLDKADVGTVVRCEMDFKGFLKSVEVLSQQLKTVGVDERPATIASRSGARDATITRLSVLRSAVKLAAGRPDLKSTDVLKIAELFEEWVLRNEPESF